MYTIKEAKVSYLLKLQTYINSKQKTLKKKNNYVLCLGNILKDITINNMKEVRVKGT